MTPLITRFVAIVVVVCCMTGMSCPNVTILPPVSLESIQFTRFEFQLLKFSEDSNDTCLAAPGTLQRAVITKTTDGLQYETWLIAVGPSFGSACEEDFSVDALCRTIEAQPPRMLTEQETALVAAAVDAMQSREEAGDDEGEMQVSGNCAIPCYRNVHTRDDVYYEQLSPCNQIYPGPYLSRTSTQAISEMLTTLQGLDGVVIED